MEELGYEWSILVAIHANKDSAFDCVRRWIENENAKIASDNERRRKYKYPMLKDPFTLCIDGESDDNFGVPRVLWKWSSNYNFLEVSEYEDGVERSIETRECNEEEQ